ncbi:MAG: hypothetical protein ABWX84_12320 [Nocardioides sp.]
MRPLRFTADLALGTVALVAVPVAVVGHRVRVLAEPALALVRDEVTRQLAEALDVVVPAAVAQVLQRLDLTKLVEDNVDIEHIVESIDLVALTNEIIAEIDLPEIIRQSTGSVASETLRGVRMQAITADDAVARLGERFRLRRARPTTAPAGPVIPAGPVPDPL